MFGLVKANFEELTQEQKHRYESVYCGICRQIRDQAGQICRLGLRYDMAFLAILLMSLYEPEESSGSRACTLHPIKPRRWVDNDVIRYGADMNVALAYYKALDDWNDEKKPSARAAVKVLEKGAKEAAARYPRQCAAMENGIREIYRLERDNCPNPDEPAGKFGQLLEELFVYREDHWEKDLRGLGNALGRFIYLADAAVDYEKDEKKKQYNPFIAMGTGNDPALWEKYLVLTMARCAEHYERLPLVQDKGILDNILYSGIWAGLFRRGGKNDA